jgi:hypothetical protein
MFARLPIILTVAVLIAINLIFYFEIKNKNLILASQNEQLATAGYINDKNIKLIAQLKMSRLIDIHQQRLYLVKYNNLESSFNALSNELFSVKNQINASNIIHDNWVQLVQTAYQPLYNARVPDLSSTTRGIDDKTTTYDAYTVAKWIIYNQRICTLENNKLVALQEWIKLQAKNFESFSK